MNNSTTNWIVIFFAVAAVAVAAWWYQQTLTEPPAEPATPVEPVPRVTEQQRPLHPLPSVPRDTVSRDLVELPALDDSDGYFALTLVELLGPDIEQQLVESGLIEKFVTTIDNFPRAHVAERVRPIAGLPGIFLVAAIDENTFSIHADNYKRYELLVDMLTNADTDSIIDAYRRFYPLLQQAYVNLGYPDDYFNDRVVVVIDHLLDSPEPAQPARLVRPHVLYQYADPELEALSSGQKLMLRIGPEHAARIKAKLRELRERIA